MPAAVFPLPADLRRRIIRRAVVSIALGAITTVLVAWMMPRLLKTIDSIGWTLPSRVVNAQSHETFPAWAMSYERNPGRERWFIFSLYEPYRNHELPVRLDLVRPWSVMHTRPSGGEIHESGLLVVRDIDSDAALTWREEVRGWPWPALALVVSDSGPMRSIRTVDPSGLPRNAVAYRHLWQLPDSWTRIRAWLHTDSLPLRPHWPGFIACTLTYGLGWFLLLFGPGLFRQMRRIHRGACLACGYDLRATTEDRCPECGRAIARPAVA